MTVKYDSTNAKPDFLTTKKSQILNFTATEDIPPKVFVKKGSGGPSTVAVWCKEPGIAAIGVSCNCKLVKAGCRIDVVVGAFDMETELSPGGTSECDDLTPGVWCNKKIIIPPGQTVEIDRIPMSLGSCVEYLLCYGDDITQQQYISKGVVHIVDPEPQEQCYAIFGCDFPQCTTSVIQSNEYIKLVENKGSNPICVNVARLFM